MSFALGKGVKPSKGFIEQKTNVTSRCDPHYYRPEFIQLDAAIRGKEHRQLRELAILSTEQWDQQSQFDVFPYIEISNIDLLLGRMGAPTLIPIAEVPSRAKMLVRPGDLLVSMTRPTRGAICFVEQGYPLAVASNGFAVIRCIDHDRVLPRYLFHVLRSSICLTQCDRNSSGGNYPAIATNAFSRILIPLPDLNLQRAYAIELDACYRKAEECLAKATHLLATLDDVLLDELGIPRQHEPPNTLASRMFQRNYSAISGRRFDPASKWKRLSFAGCRVQLCRLPAVVAVNPITHPPRVAPETPVTFVPMDAVSDLFGEGAEKQTRSLCESGSYTVFQDEDVIWAKITPCMENGKSAVVRGLVSGYGFGSTEFHVFRCKSSCIIPDYLHLLLRMKKVREHARLNFTGSSGHQRVDEDFFFRMEIPLPSIAAQRRIVAQAEAAKNKAKALFAQARADLEAAKREIEALILGKDLTV